jgi:hypothetical protein
MIYDIQTNNFTGILHQVSNELAAVNSEYEIYAEDAAHWYNEGTATALFSVACWRIGYPALCESGSTKKVYTGSRGAPRNSNGRVDIFLYNEDDDELWIEAKKPHGAFDASEVSSHKLTDAILDQWVWQAWESAQQNYHAAKENGGVLCALVFLSFKLESSYYTDEDSVLQRRERASELNMKIGRYCSEKECFFSSYFNSSHVEIENGDGHRPFGFSMIGYLEKTGTS